MVKRNYPIDGTDSAGPPIDEDDEPLNDGPSGHFGPRQQIEGSKDDVDRGPGAPLSHLNAPKWPDAPDGRLIKSPLIITEKGGSLTIAEDGISQIPARSLHMEAESGKYELKGQDAGLTVNRTLRADPPRQLRTDVSEPIGSPPQSEIALTQLRGLIIAFEEAVDYDPVRHHNIRTQHPALWIDNPDYLNDIKALLHELRRLNDLLRTPAAPEPEKIEKSTSEIVHAARKISDEAYGVIGKGLGAVILLSLGSLVVSLGAPELGQTLMSAIKGGSSSAWYNR